MTMDSDLEHDDDEGDFETGEDRSDRLNAIFDALREEYSSEDLSPVIQALRASYDIEGLFKEFDTEIWSGPISGPYVKFQNPLSVSFTMKCKEGIEVRANYSEGGLLETLFQVIFDLPNSPKSRTIYDVVYTDAADLKYVITAVHRAIVQRHIGHKEALEIAMDVRQQISDVKDTYKTLVLEIEKSLSEMKLNSDFSDPTLAWDDDDYLCFSTDVHAFAEEKIWEATFLSTLHLKVYGDGHVRLEHDRRDVPSPAVAAALMKTELSEGRARPGIGNLNKGREAITEDDSSDGVIK